MWAKLLKVGKGAAIAAGGAALAYLVAVDWSDFGPVIAAVASVALNALYQFLKKGE